MKRARKVIAAYAIVCPYCGDEIAEPGHGSLTWEAGQVHKDQVVSCFSCGKSSKL